MRLTNRQIVILIAALVGVLILIIVIMNMITRRKPTATPETNPEVIKKEVQKVIEITEIPRISDEKGGGIDADSPEVKTSIQSLQKLQSSLPYYKTFTTEDGIEVEVSIPPTSTVSNDWTLLVHIFGPDYQIPEDSSDYEAQKQAFLAGVSEVMLFLEEQDINPSEIIIQWGDRAIIGDRSAKWLSE